MFIKLIKVFEIIKIIGKEFQKTVHLRTFIDFTFSINSIFHAGINNLYCNIINIIYHNNLSSLNFQCRKMFECLC